MCSGKPLVTLTGSLSLWHGSNVDITRACSRSLLDLLGTLRVSDRSHRGAVLTLISPDQPSLCVSDRNRDPMKSLEGPSLTALQEFHDAVLDVRNI